MAAPPADCCGRASCPRRPRPLARPCGSPNRPLARPPDGAHDPHHRLLFGHRPRRRADARGARLAGLRDLPGRGGLRAAPRRGPRELPPRPRRRRSVAEAAAEALARTGGPLDAVFNNGAFAIPGAVEDLPRAALRAIFETNLFGQIDLTNRLLPAMRAAGGGRLVFTSSVLGLVAAPWRGAYVATKFALEGIVDTLRIELAGSGITRRPDRARADRDALPPQVDPALRTRTSTGGLRRTAPPTRRASSAGSTATDPETGPLRAAAGGGDRLPRRRAREPAPPPALLRHHADPRREPPARLLPTAALDRVLRGR